jgi:hypothetical protein
MAITGAHDILYTSEPEAVREIFRDVFGWKHHIQTTVAELGGKGIDVRGEPQEERFGVVATIVLPGGLEVMLYEPRHPTAI